MHIYQKRESYIILYCKIFFNLFKTVGKMWDIVPRLAYENIKEEAERCQKNNKEPKYH